MKYTRSVSKAAAIASFILTMTGTAQAQSVSSSSRSSSFVNSSGAGASSSAVFTSPAGTNSQSQTVFIPGATSASASASATGSSTGPNFVSATVNVPGVTHNPITSGLPEANVLAVGTLAANGGVFRVAVTTYLAPTTTFIPTFSAPLSLVPSRPTSYRVEGLPSRVFPGLGLYYIPE
jgi:hypothetical protein